MTPNPYCALPADHGLTCLRDSLIRLRRLANDRGDQYTHIETLYQCPVCGGLYKYVYHSLYETRNFDAEAGWAVNEDHYYKVGESNGIAVRFPMGEARLYGYHDETAEQQPPPRDAND